MKIYIILANPTCVAMPLKERKFLFPFPLQTALYYIHTSIVPNPLIYSYLPVATLFAIVVPVPFPFPFPHKTYCKTIKGILHTKFNFLSQSGEWFRNKSITNPSDEHIYIYRLANPARVAMPIPSIHLNSFKFIFRSRSRSRSAALTSLHYMLRTVPVKLCRTIGLFP